MSCIFCKIIDGEIPSYTLYEDEHIVAFLDITQGTKGHTLIVPKKHTQNLYTIDSETIKRVFEVAPIIANAIKKAFNPIGLTLVNNTEKPLQSVFHFHVHLVPRYEDDGMVLTTLNQTDAYTNEAYLKVKDAIKRELE